MENIGIIRELDNLGRMTIPKEWRDLYKFEGPLEIVAIYHLCQKMTTCAKAIAR